MTDFDHREHGTPALVWDPALRDLPHLPLPPPGRRLVVLVAHPDDETLGVGGLIAAASSVGRETLVVVATDGERSHPNSTTTTPAQLAAVRRAEAQQATTALGARLVLLGLPDGRLADHLPLLQAAAAEHSRPGDWLLTPWARDGHPDHQACARAAAVLTDRRRFEFPVWAWHWGGPGLVDATWVARPLTLVARAAKQRALAAYISQTRPLSDRAGDEPVLSASFLAHFARGVEVLIDPVSRPAAEPGSFDALYEAGEPWGLERRWYERRKRQVVLAALPHEELGRVFEPGAGPGFLTDQLAARAREVVAWDASRAATRLAAQRGVAVDCRRIPGDWPGGGFDTVVLHEVGYYVRDLDTLADRVTGSLAGSGVLLACHWWRDAPDHPWRGEEVHAHLHADPRLCRTTTWRDADFGLDVFVRRPER